MAGDDVRVRLCQQQIVKLDLEIKAVIQDIQRCDGPLEKLEELNRVVAEKIKEIKTRFEELERIANEQDKETSRLSLLKDLDNNRKQLTASQSSLRRANLICQMTMEKKEKEELFDGGSEVRQRRPHSSKEALTSTASNITDNLISLRRLMASQVKHSEETMGTLVTSSKQVGETHEEFRNMSGHIQSSHKLLTKYGRRECTDKLLIFLALVFFFASVLYVIKKRLFSSSEDTYYEETA